MLLLALLASSALLALSAPTTQVPATTTTSSTAPPTLYWKWKNEWTDPSNWVGGATPQFGEIVTFPPIMSTWGIEMCLSATDVTCPIGAVVSIDCSQEPQASTVELPANGRFLFESDGEFTLASNSEFLFNQDYTPTVTQWNDPGETARDFKCAANWNVVGLDSNPNFVSPCLDNTIDLSDVSRHSHG